MRKVGRGSQVFAGVKAAGPEGHDPRRLEGMRRRFGDLRVRPKLMLLHNVFFLVLTLGVYLTSVNLVQSRLEQARAREVSLILNSFSTLDPASEDGVLRPYELKTGTAADFGLPESGRAWMSRYPGRIWQRSPESEHVFRLIPGSERFYRITLPLDFYSSMAASLKLGVLLALGVVYLLAVLVLELLIMPLYVYQPLQLMLDSDAATRRGDRVGEIIAEDYIPGDEIGQIMRSRNETVQALRQHEDELEMAKRNLEAQDRLVSLGLLSASVAHEMNTPLAVLHGSIEKLLETVQDPSAQARLARMIRVTQRLRRISEGLLDFARAGRREMSRVEMRGVVEEAWQLVEMDEKAAYIHFLNEVSAGDAVAGDADKLVQVMVNLIRNALIAVPAESGQICVYSRRRSIEGKPAVSVIVEDNGPGIPPEVLPEIFDAFVTTRLDARGTGLGLTVAEGIVNQHHGVITAANRPGGGARLEVLLPAAVEEQGS
jgi:signal transduction histidine kinase